MVSRPAAHARTARAAAPLARAAQQPGPLAADAGRIATRLPQMAASVADCLMQDEVEHIMLSGLGAKDLARAAQVRRGARACWHMFPHYANWRQTGTRPPLRGRAPDAPQPGGSGAPRTASPSPGFTPRPARPPDPRPRPARSGATPTPGSAASRSGSARSPRTRTSGPPPPRPARGLPALAPARPELARANPAERRHADGGRG